MKLYHGTIKSMYHPLKLFVFPVLYNNIISINYITSMSAVANFLCILIRLHFDSSISLAGFHCRRVATYTRM